jgi:biopolymer transport protein ExbB
MAASFHTLAGGADASAEQLAGGVQLALATTLEGLAVAAPAVVAFVYLRNRLARAIADIGAAVEDLFERARERSGVDAR